ncbi:MAG: hypothetical protein K940chlam6_00181 [Chlamydiae bacterium]|nr:hypothetical protein [Chlamydiota bacterium]
MVEINTNFIDFFEQCRKLTPEEIATRQLALDKKEYPPTKNDNFCLATAEEISNIVQKSMQLTQADLSNFNSSNESEASFLELVTKVENSFEFHKSLLLTDTKIYLTSRLLGKNVDELYFNIKYLKGTYDTDQLTKIFQNISTLANKLNTGIENDFASKVLQVIAPTWEDSLLEAIKLVEDYALGKKDIEIFNPDQKKNSDSLNFLMYFPAGVLIGGFMAHMYFHS